MRNQPGTIQFFLIKSSQTNEVKYKMKIIRIDHEPKLNMKNL